MFNSKGDNLGQIAIQIKFEIVWWVLLLNNDMILLTDTYTRFWCSVECHLPSTKRVLMENTDFQLRAIIPL